MQICETFNMSNDDEQTKKIVKEAIKEWLSNEKNTAYQTLGKWVANLFAGLIVAALLYLTLWANGFKHG